MQYFLFLFLVCFSSQPYSQPIDLDTMSNDDFNNYLAKSLAKPDPLTDELYIVLRKKPISELSERELDYRAKMRNKEEQLFLAKEGKMPIADIIIVSVVIVGMISFLIFALS